MKPVFITFHLIINKPGNPISIARIRLDIISCFRPCDEEFCKLGASTQLSTSVGELFVSESYEDTCKLIENACVEQSKGV